MVLEEICLPFLVKVFNSVTFIFPFLSVFNSVAFYLPFLVKVFNSVAF